MIATCAPQAVPLIGAVILGAIFSLALCRFVSK